MRKSITVPLGQRSYNVIVGAGVTADLPHTVADMGDVTSVVVITETTVNGLFAEKVLTSLTAAGLIANCLAFPAGEGHKTLETYSDLMDQIFSVAPPIDRKTIVVALGGGVAGDVAGFVAATALRGLRWIQCPTTLLADVDASVGGKTAVDHPAGKNLIGSFHQPAAVLVDVDALGSLPAAELGNGLAECVKHGIIRDPNLLTFLTDRADDILACQRDVMTDLITRNVEIKAAVVGADERESGERAHLNFGHTIGHAIEVLVGYDQIPHGQAVALGMVAAFRMATERGLIGEDDAAAVMALLMRLELPVSREGLDAGKLWRIMQHDKKTAGGRVKMVLPTRLGEVIVVDDVTDADVADAVAAIAV